MAKLFYSLEEAAQKLDMTEDQVMELVKSGQLQEFRDQDRLMFKVEQVDLLTGEEEDDTGGIPLATDDDSGEFGSLGDQDSRESSGISIFDTDETEYADAAAQTHVEGAAFDSGELDATASLEDSGMGSDIAGEFYGAETAGGETVGATLSDESALEAGGDLFESAETTTMASPGGAAAAVPAAQPDKSAGMYGGLALGIALLCSFSIALVLSAVSTGGAVGPWQEQVGNNWMAISGGMAGAVVLFGLIGWFIGRR